MSAAAVGGVTVARSFDPIGRLSSQTEGASTTRFLFVGTSTIPVFDVNAAGEIISSSTTGPEGSLAIYSGAPATGTSMRFAYYNAHGDIVAQTDGTGSVTDTYTYDAFGVMSGSAPNVRNQQWLGRYQKRADSITGLVLLGKRSYDPHTGRFLSMDPIDGGGLNPYDGSLQDPINNVDTSGESAVPVEPGGGVQYCRSTTGGLQYLYLHVHWCYRDGLIFGAWTSWEITHQDRQFLHGYQPEWSPPRKYGGAGYSFFVFEIDMTWIGGNNGAGQDGPLPNADNYVRVYVNGYGQHHATCGVGESSETAYNATSC
jgi:RHS repeat-associated protein